MSSEGRFQQTIMNAAIRVFSVDDHALFREGIAMIINCQPGMLMVAQASNGREAIELFREHKPDVTLMDLRLPDMSSIDAMIAIRTDFPGARIIILTTFESDTERQRALAQGARARSCSRARIRRIWRKRSVRFTASDCNGYSVLRPPLALDGSTRAISFYCFDSIYLNDPGDYRIHPGSDSVRPS